MAQDVKNPQYWNELWKQHLLQGERKCETVEESIKSSIERWEKRAKPFAENVLGNVGNPRVAKIIDWMENQGVQLDGISVLDIGSGPGAFTIPFAQTADRVVALEPVQAMADILREQVEKSGKHNVEVVEEPWETVDIQDKRWEEAFDLVFASMVPGISDMETAEKAIRCSRKYCYISSFAGRRQFQGVIDLWPILFEHDQPTFHLDIQYLLNIIYTKGYAFSLKVWEENKQKQLSAEEACDELLKQMLMAVDEKVADKFHRQIDTMQIKIREYVNQNLVNGMYTYKSTVRLAAILVEK